jgi:hypothetical protein
MPAKKLALGSPTYPPGVQQIREAFSVRRRKDGLGPESEVANSLSGWKINARESARGKREQPRDRTVQ